METELVERVAAVFWGCYEAINRPDPTQRRSWPDAPPDTAQRLRLDAKAAARSMKPDVSDAEIAEAWEAAIEAALRV